MRPVALVQVVGPPGGGKTTFIERLLQSSRKRVMAAVRIVVDGDVRVPELDPAGDADTARYTAAGARVSQRILVPPGWPDVLSALDASDGALHSADTILIEGGPVQRDDVDAVVFVTLALAAGDSLTQVEQREIGRLDGREVLRLMVGLSPVPSEAEQAELDAFEALVEASDDGLLAEEEVIESFEIPDAAAEWILELLEHGYPVNQQVTEFRPGFEALAEAQLAVVTGDDAEAVPATCAAINGLRRNEALLRSLHRYHAGFGPRTVLAADLRDPRDIGTRKAVEAVKRRMRAAQW